MTARAREVLEDCKIALNEIQDGITGREWRVRWVAAVALLRAVGHVLDKVDAPGDPLLRRLVDDAWRRLEESKPNPAVFWQFIEEERNHILKEYRIGAGQGVTIRLGTAHLDLQSGEQWSEPGLPTLYHYTVNSGPYEGRDQREVLQEAIDWWDAYLGRIEDAYRKEKSAG